MNDLDKLKLIRFTAAMEIEQENNDYKGPITEWDASLQDKLYDFEYHKAKLMIAIKEENKEAIREFIADCANILLAMGDHFGLYDERQAKRDKCYRLKEPSLKEGPINPKEPQVSTGVTYYS